MRRDHTCMKEEGGGDKEVLYCFKLPLPPAVIFLLK